MHVLLVEDEKTTRVSNSRLAESFGHQVSTAESAEEAMTILARGGVDLLFTDLVLPKRSGIELTQWVRSREKDSHLYVLLLTARDGHELMEQAFAAGIDDFVTKGASRIELAGRFRVAERIVRVEQSLRRRAEELEQAMRRLDISAAMRGKVAVSVAEKKAEPAKKELLAEVGAWKKLGDTLRAALSENTHQDFAPGEVTSPFAADAMGARITLTDVAHKVELEIVLVAAQASAREIAASVFGDPDIVDEALIADTMLELANGTMGAFKSSFADDDYKFTAGIPKPVPVRAPAEMLATARDKRVLGYTSGSVAMTVLLGVREKQNAKVKVGNLRDGMVLAEPVSRGGVMLLKAGTRLSEALIERLYKIDKDMVVELSDPAD